MNIKTTLFTLLCLTATTHTAPAQTSVPAPSAAEQGYTYPKFNIKTNLLYDATATINLGVEFGLGHRTSLDVPLNYNGWTFSDNKKWKHFLVQPGFRWWTSGERFKGGFWGVHAHYAIYNVGGLDNPPFSEYMSAHRFEGWLAGAGVSYGYRWNFGQNRPQGSRWAMEAEIGVGYAYLSYDKFPCYTCGRKIGSETKNYFGPTKAAVSLIYSFGGKKKPVQSYPLLTTTSAPVQRPEPTYTAVPAPYEPRFAVAYVSPQAEGVKQRSESGRAFLDFAAGKSTILPDFKNNASELAKINEIVREVKSNPDATITGITITGYASPEGTYATNLALSEKRAAALKEYIRTNYAFPESMLRVEGKGEDWPGLDTLVSNSYMVNKEAILSIIRSTDIFDGRERKLMNLAGGAPYKEMLTSMFPQLRRVEYQLGYTVKPFTVEQGKEVFRTKPANLSLNEMFLIAQTYTPGSAEFNELFETAARLFPQSDEANLNAAANALSRNDIVSAEKYLDKVQNRTAEWYDNRGILLYLQGNLTEAAGCFKQAQTTNAAELQKALDNRAEIERITRENAQTKAEWQQRRTQ